MTDEPRPEPRVFRSDDMVRLRRMPAQPRREHDPEVLATLERGRRKRIQEYLDSRREKT
ncbi:MAG TPA: hypothetical protein VLA69_07490 [Gaiellaceae bacterium]|nr:hypothetical protein [Gaiellaceae bacterium]